MQTYSPLLCECVAAIIFSFMQFLAWMQFCENCLRANVLSTNLSNVFPLCTYTIVLYFHTHPTSTMMDSNSIQTNLCSHAVLKKSEALCVNVVYDKCFLSWDYKSYILCVHCSNFEFQKSKQVRLQVWIPKTSFRCVSTLLTGTPGVFFCFLSLILSLFYDKKMRHPQLSNIFTMTTRKRKNFTHCSAQFITWSSVCQCFHAIFFIPGGE